LEICHKVTPLEEPNKDVDWDSHEAQRGLVGFGVSWENLRGSISKTKNHFKYTPKYREM